MTVPTLRCAMLTPTGRGAVAVIAVWGAPFSTAETILDPLFESASGKKLQEMNRSSVFYGRWKPTREDIVIVRLTDHFEIHCHGGKVAPLSILKSLHEKGVREASTDEASALCEKRPWLAEVNTAMTHATTERTALILLSQYHQARKLIAELEFLIEAGESKSAELIARLDQFLSWERFGQHLTTPWSVVLCGRPNVGKSSLINAIIGFERAIVHELAGTTRDVVTQLTAVEGWPIELKDTAGLRESDDAIEQQGVALSQNEIDQADLVIAVIDASQLDAIANWELVDAVKAAIVVVNKIDLIDDPQVLDQWTASRPASCERLICTTSTTEKKGIEELVLGIAERLVPCEPSSDILVPITSGQTRMIQQLRELIKSKNWPTAEKLVENW